MKRFPWHIAAGAAISIGLHLLLAVLVIGAARLALDFEKLETSVAPDDRSEEFELFPD